jgi:pimeloyl-ACP methyl ester carboxylesterase
MKKLLILIATVVSALAILLALDVRHFAFKYIDAGGHQLRMLICGHGSPVVVFETGGSPGAGGPLEAWEKVQPGVSKFTSTVAYDRAGTGRSKPGPRPRDARQVALELHTALQNAHVLPPYILVGHSFGGPLNRVFAGMYPTEVAGMVLVDPTQEEFIDWNQAHDPNHKERKDDEWKDIQASLTEAHESKVPEGIPVTLITAMGPRVFPSFVTEKQKEEIKTFRPVWLKFHQEWVDKLPNAWHIITEESGHVVPFEEPELVIRTIQQTVEQNISRPDHQH